MTKKHRWKTILLYLAGILALAASIAAAMLAPDWYASWQDGRIMNHASLSNRDSINFIDAETLDVTGRLQMLAETERIYAEDSDYFFMTTDEQVWEKMQRLLVKWYGAGLLPESCVQRIQEPYFYSDSIMYLQPYSVHVDQGVLPVIVARFLESERGDMLTVIMDMEKDILYYVSFSGEDAMNEMAAELGYPSSYQQMAEQRGRGVEPEKRSEDFYDSFDFASVCGAESAEVLGTEEMLELSVTLEFDTFSSCAYRKVVTGEAGFGMAVMYGTQWWPSLLVQISEAFGYDSEQVETTEVWYSYLDTLAFADDYTEEKVIQ